MARLGSVGGLSQPRRDTVDPKSKCSPWRTSHAKLYYPVRQSNSKCGNYKLSAIKNQHLFNNSFFFRLKNAFFNTENGDFFGKCYSPIINNIGNLKNAFFNLWFPLPHSPGLLPYLNFYLSLFLIFLNLL